MAKSFAREIKMAFKAVDTQMRQAQQAALNRAARTALRSTMDFIRSKYNIKLKDLRQYTTLDKANKNRLSVIITVRDKSIPLIQFGAKVKGRKKATKKTKAIRGEVNVQQRIGEIDVYKKAFIVKSPKTGEKAVFIRTTKERGPIRELLGPSAMQLFGSQKAQKELEKVFFDRLKIEMDYAINHFVK